MSTVVKQVPISEIQTGEAVVVASVAWTVDSIDLGSKDYPGAMWMSSGQAPGFDLMFTVLDPSDKVSVRRERRAVLRLTKQCELGSMAHAGARDKMHASCPKVLLELGFQVRCECACHDGERIDPRRPMPSLPVLPAFTPGFCEHCGVPCNATLAWHHEHPLRRLLRAQARDGDHLAAVELQLRRWKFERVPEWVLVKADEVHARGPEHAIDVVRQRVYGRQV